MIFFSNEFNLYFGYPHSDTCSTCDSLQLQIEGTDNVEEKEKLEAELKRHHTLAVICCPEKRLSAKQRLLVEVELSGYWFLTEVFCQYSCMYMSIIV